MPWVIERFPMVPIARRPPLTIENKVHPNFYEQYCALEPRCALFLLRNARIVGREGYVLSNDFRIFEEFTYHSTRPSTDYPIFYRLRPLPGERRVEGLWATITFPDTSAFFHFDIESLPRIHLLGEYESVISGLVVPSNLRPSQRKVLAELGYGASRLLEVGEQSHFTFDQLLVPNYIAGKNMPRWLRDFFGSARFKKSDVPCHKRVYLSRADASWRRVLNEPEVVGALAPYGIVPVQLSELEPEDQRSLFANADLVVAPHGAALSNLTYCRPGATLVEFFSPHHVDVSYWALSRTMQLEYAYLVGAERPREKLKPDFEDIVLDTEKLQRTLDLVGCSRA